MTFWGLLAFGAMAAGSLLVLGVGLIVYAIASDPVVRRNLRRECGPARWTPDCYTPVSATPKER